MNTLKTIFILWGIILFLHSQNVGIGTATPTEKLDVAGNVQFSGALMPAGDPGNKGEILTSQGPGTPPQWKTLSTGSTSNCPPFPCPTQWGTVSTTAMTWGACARWCVNSTEGGFTDWRMPTIKDIWYLYMTVDGGTDNKYIWTASFPGEPGILISNGNPADYVHHFYIWRILDGYWSLSWPNNIYYCRCVR